MYDEKQIELKKQFAIGLMRDPDKDAHKVAFDLVTDTGTALEIARCWPKDSIVIAEMNRLQSTKEIGVVLYSKDEQAANILAIAVNTNVDIESRLKAHRLYAELCGHITKEATTISTNIITNHVIKVIDHGSDDEWERKAMGQQEILLDGHALAANSDN